MSKPSRLKINSDKIIISNIILVAAITISFNIIAYNAEEAKGIGVLYFGFMALMINIFLLLALAVGSYIKRENELGKNFLASILYSILTYGLIQFCFLFLI